MNVFLNTKLYHYYDQFPLMLIDVGARGGMQNNWSRARRFLRVIGFEPDPKEFEHLLKGGTSSNTTYLNTALDNKTTTRILNLTRSGGVSSIFAPNRDFLNRFPEYERFDVLKTIPLSTDTLDNQLHKNQIQDVDFIKVDTQGSELYILQGGEKTISNSVFGIEVEVEFASMYQGQPLFADVDNYLRSIGYQLFDLRPCYWKRSIGKDYGGPKGQIIFADALYFRDYKSFHKISDKISDMVEKKSKILRSLSLCVLYGYLDYALELVGSTYGVFSDDEYNLIKVALTSEIPISNKIPYFRGRSRIANLFYKLYRMFSPTYNGWATGGTFLGNIE
jgi:FkbM family methyltransferase